MPKDIIFLHGGGQGGWVWAETIAAMELQIGRAIGRMVVLDVPGCGKKRGRDTENLSIPDVIAELANELDTLDVRNALLVGHSQAGTVLPGLVAAKSNRIARAVYFACAAPGQGQTVTQIMGVGLQGSNENEVGWPRDPRTTSPTDLFRAAFCNDMNEEMALAFTAKLGSDHWPAACGNVWNSWSYDAARVVPATYVIALADQILPVTWQERFAARLNASRLLRLDSGHQGMNSRPHQLAEILITEARLDP